MDDGCLIRFELFASLLLELGRVHLSFGAFALHSDLQHLGGPAFHRRHMSRVSDEPGDFGLEFNFQSQLLSVVLISFIHLFDGPLLERLTNDSEEYVYYPLNYGYVT